MRWFSEADGGNPDGTAKDRVGLTAGTTYLAKYWNDNFFNLFNTVTKSGYSLIDNNLEQLHKANRGLYVPTFTYNTSAIATQTVNDIVLGSNGAYYEAQADAISGDNPVGSITGNWKLYQPYKTGQKNLLINGRKLIQQRAVTGGRKQVILNTMNGGGVHTISWTGTATVTIKEATTLGASDALTTWDTALVTAGTSGTTVALTAGKYIKVEFSTTDFNFAQLEQGSVATNFEYRHNELDLGLPYYERVDNISQSGYNIAGSGIGCIISFKAEKISVPIVIAIQSPSLVNAATYTATPSTKNFLAQALVGSTGSANFGISTKAITAFNAEIFKADDGVGINYKEDRWYV